MKPLKDGESLFLHSHAGLLRTRCSGVDMTADSSTRMFCHPARVWSLCTIRAQQEFTVVKVGLLGGPTPLHPLCCQVPEEVSLLAWRGELAPTLEIWDCRWLIAQFLQWREASVTQRCRPTPSHCFCCIISLHWRRNKACCCLSWHTDPTPETQNWNSSLIKFLPTWSGSRALAADGSNKVHSAQRSSQATLKSHLFPDAAAISSLRRSGIL